MSHIISPARVSDLFGSLVTRAKTMDDEPEASALSGESHFQKAGMINASLVLSPLEKLPLELQVLILILAPDFATLRGIIFASPILYKAYVSSKAIILSSLVYKQQVPGTEVDALAALLSLDYADGMQDHPDEVIAFLDRYRHARGRGRWLRTKNPPLPVQWRSVQTDVDDLVTVVRFHNLTEFLTDRFLEYMDEKSGHDFAKADGLITISMEERMRIHRAIYRLQTYHHLFGMVESTSRMQTDSLFVGPEGENTSQSQIWDLFFRTFTGWERKEMYTMHDFVFSRTMKLMATLISHQKKDVRRIVPHDDFHYLPFESIACAGPLFLAKAMHLRTLEQQYSLVADNFECLLYSRSKSIGLGPIASSITSVCGVEILRAHQVLYPSDEIMAAISFPGQGRTDFSLMPSDERPSAGFQFYVPNYQYFACGDLSIINTYWESERATMLLQIRKLMEFASQSSAFWDEGRMSQLWSRSDDSDNKFRFWDI